jgi:hypothetical protein
MLGLRVEADRDEAGLDGAAENGLTGAFPAFSLAAIPLTTKAKFMARDPHAPVRKGAYEPLTAAEHRENMVRFKIAAEHAASDRLNGGAAQDDRLLGAVKKDEVADQPSPNSPGGPGATN